MFYWSNTHVIEVEM